MGINSYISKTDAANLPKAKRSLLQTIGDPVLSAIDAPGNATRSLILGIRTGDLGAVLNAPRSLVPFAGSYHVSGEEAIGTNNLWAGLAVELLADPLIAISGVGKVTKTGKLLEGIKELRVLESAYKARGLTKEAAEIGVRLAKLKQEYKAIPKAIRATVPRRNILELELVPFVKQTRIPIGDTRELKKAIASLPIGALPDRRLDYYRRALKGKEYKLRFAERQLAEFEAAGVREGAKYEGTKKSIEKLNESISRLKGRIARYPTRLTLPSNFARQAWRVSDYLDQHFGRKVGKQSKAIKDITLSQEALDAYLLGEKQAAYLNDIETVAKAEGKSVSALMSRVVRGAEARGFSRKSTASLSDELAQAITEANKISDPVVRGQAKADAFARLEGQAEEIRLVGETPVIRQRELDADLAAKISALVDESAKDLKEAELITNPIKRGKAKAKVFDDIANKEEAIRIEAYRRSERLEEAAKLYGIESPENLSPAELDLINVLSDDFNKMIAIEQAVRIPISPLDTKAHMSYVTRLLTDEAKKLRRKDKKRFKILLGEAKIHLANATKRSIFPEKSISEINQMMKDTLKIDFNFFSEDVVQLAVSRKLNHLRAVHKAKGVLAAVELTARDKSVLKGGRSVRQFLKKHGLTPDEIGGLKAIDKDLRLPRSIWNDFLKFDRLTQDSIFNERELHRFLKFMDSHVNAAYRLLLTTPFPAFHHRNAFSNWFLNHLGGVSNLKWYHRAAKLQKAVAKGTANADELKLWKELAEYRVIKAGQYYEFDILVQPETKFGRVAKRVAEKPISEAQKALKLGTPTRRFDPGMGRAYGAWIEDNARIAHYRAKKAEGLTPIEASRSVQKYLYDYTDLTAFERRVMRPTFLFYTWMRKNIPLMVNTSIENPRLVKLYEDFVRQGRDEVPDWLKVASVVPNPFGEGYISDPGIPLLDLNFMNVDDVDPNIPAAFSRMTQRVISRTAPWIKMPYELATGEISFSGKPIKDLWKDFVYPNLPISRVTRETSRVFDPDVALYARMIDALSGMRIYKYSKLKGKRANIERRAISSGKFQRLGNTYILLAKEKYKEDPGVEAIKKELREINKKIKARSKR